LSLLKGKTYTKFGDTGIPDPEIDRVITTSGVWAYLKIAEGCDNRCAYCVIPDIRGRFRSRPMENILSEARELAARGIKELIIVAQDTTRYGLDLYGERRLPELLVQLCAIEGLKWIRLHYLYPDEISDMLIDVIAENDKILRYLDIPIQHISDSILKRMCRRGSGADIRALFKKLRAKIPGVVLRTSLITGLPGEGEEEYQELYAFLKDTGIERAGVFPFSPEEGTEASGMEYPDNDTACARAEAIMALQADILAEGFDGTYYYGRSYAESPEIDGLVYFTGDGVKMNDFNLVRIKDTLDGEPLGVLMEE
jgi:ribosomal protein S12 methylthiotransferase